MSDKNEAPVTLMVYYEALNRLVAGKPISVSKGTKISVTSVAVEAGRSPGSIKKQRSVFAPLIQEIHIRAKEQQERSKPGASQVQQAKEKASKAREEASGFKAKYEAALARELMLLIAWDELTQELRKVAKVVSIKPPSRP
ncbi:hypothetical protein [Pseudomonas migulae]|uniref:Uncharacterized protein n=1 Tax=Pseudomonas migulae TaxID=78543 RepID=A0A1H5H9T0_9PSED|nr:hypothetical protein [Pseudomonas migulae]SEE24719.1 hypothetical protein SAMN04490194_1526 [Pseudomonas migulae]